MTDKNEEDLPVEKLILTVNNDGVVKNVKALDPHWVESCKLLLYQRPPNGSELKEPDIDNWNQTMNKYLTQLHWLLSMEHHIFWSTIVHHPQCMDMLISFLQEANPPYMEMYEKSIQPLYQEIRKYVLVVFCRLITNKESKAHHMRKDFMKDLLYNKFIFTIPILWDICLVYGNDNCQHVSRILDSVFTLQPQYTKDLETALVFVKEAFKYITLQVNKNYDTIEPPNLPETFAGFSEIRRPSSPPVDHGHITFAILKDLVVHLLDTVITLRIFVEAYPKCVGLMKRIGFILSIIQLYEFAIPHLYEKLDEVGPKNTTVHGYIDTIRAELIDIFRETIAVYKHKIFNSLEDMEVNVEAYLSVMMEGLSENLFMRDYHACYPVHEDIEMLKLAYPNIDTVKTDFILQAIYSNLDEPVSERTERKSTPVMNGFVQNDIVQPGPSKEIEIPTNVKEESLLSEVKDIFPHLGDGFIQKCLKYYEFDTEKVINCLLEDTLSKDLAHLDRSLPIIPEDICDQKFLETGIDRLNVFDGDEFDIMTRNDVDTSKIHVGKKKSKYKNLGAMLDDKSAVKSRLDIYSKYNLVCDDEDMYSDEYDDTYDDEAGVVPAGDVCDDMGRPFVTPRALLKPTPRDIQVEDSSSSEDEAQETRNKLDFCSNPEEIRAKREANRLRNNKKGPPPIKNTDVTGKPKGQGQEKDVLKNRDNKEKHKSTKSNHNRRQGAQWKRTRGMIPS